MFAYIDATVRIQQLNFLPLRISMQKDIVKACIVIPIYVGWRYVNLQLNWLHYVAIIFIIYVN